MATQDETNAACSISNEIDSICDAFDRAWRSGGLPGLAEFLDRADAAHRGRLFRELLAVELEYRRTRGEMPDPSDYTERFADYAETIADVFAGSSSRDDRTQVSTVIGAADPSADAAEIKPHAAGTFIGRQFGDYELIEEIARGGMGVVFRARETRLSRVVALKMIGSGAFASEEEIRRFQAEAEAAARLDHPGIVPVYEVGECDGRHYFSMALVDGQTLAELLRNGPLPAHRAAAILELMSEAVHFAHEKGVIHRDLKPGNVLLAELPESGDRSTDSPNVAATTAGFQPRITDFGLAKRVDVESELTATRQVLGTPAYMPPEQAAGRVSEIGRQSDVYALGAILYASLTGRPPHQAATLGATLHQVLTRDPVPPGTQNSAVPRDLATICLKCLEKEPRRRYTTAAALRDDLARFRNGRPILARPVGRIERTYRWAKRNPLATGLISALAAVIVAGFIGVDTQRRAALENLADANEQRAEAEEQRREAVANLQLARQAVDRFHTEVADSPELRAHGLESLRTSLLEQSRLFYEQFVAIEADDPAMRLGRAAAYGRLARIVAETQTREAAVELLLKAKTSLEELLKSDPDNLAIQSDLATALNDLGVNTAALGRAAAAESYYQRASAIRKEQIEREPDEPKYRDELAAVQSNLGLLQQQRRRLDDAEGALRQSMEQYAQLRATYPDVDRYRLRLAVARFNLANVLLARQKYQEARQHYDEAVSTFATLRRQSPHVPYYAKMQAAALVNRGIVFARTGRREDLVAAFEQARNIDRELANRHPAVNQYQFALANGEFNLGRACLDADRKEQAESSFRSAAERLDALVAKEGGVPLYMQMLANAENSLAAIYQTSRRTDDAIALFQQSATRWRKLLTADGDNPDYLRGLSRSLNRLGNGLETASRLTAARDAYSESVQIQERLPRDQPENAVGLGGDFVNLGNVHVRLDEDKVAVGWFDKAVAILGPHAAASPPVDDARTFLLNAFTGRAEAFTELGLHAKAALDWDRALKLDDDSRKVLLRSRRMLSLARAGHTNGAMRDAVALLRETTSAKRQQDVIVASFHAARVYSLAAATARRDNSPPAKQAEVAAKRVKSALFLLSLIDKQNVFSDPDIARELHHADFRALRNETEFQRLLNRGEAARGPTAPRP